RAVLNVVVGASAAAAIAAGTRWHRPGRRLAWWLVAAAQGLFVVGDALFSVNELVLGIEPFRRWPTPSTCPATRCWPPAWPCSP
ncbi:MAG TPA: hypothetical protein VG673_19030, partial [Actinomycetota bacterium]|nr:hypothetical protein [Actinomycetota bacterium]